MSETEHTYLCPGSKLGDFVVKELIGVGGYGQIYEVVDSSTDVRRAMKVEFFDAEKHDPTNFHKKIIGNILAINCNFSVKVIKYCI